MVKGVLFHELTVKLAYWASNIFVSNVAAYLASDKFSSIIGPNSGIVIHITDKHQFELWLYAKVFAVVSFLTVILQHYFHQVILLPKIQNMEVSK